MAVMQKHESADIIKSAQLRVLIRSPQEKCFLGRYQFCKATPKQIAKCEILKVINKYFETRYETNTVYILY